MKIVPVKNPELEDVPIIKGAYDDIGDWVLDPNGYFLIRIRDSTLEIAHCKQVGVIDRVITGDRPQEVYFTAIKEGLLSRLDHAAYLGKELQKAYDCLKDGREYVQDE